MFTALTKPIWTATPVPQAEAVRLTWNVQADVCVVGAGIAGLSVALCLLEHGRSVIVLDRYDVGEGETLRTSGHLSSALDDRYVELERLHGEGGARMAAESHRAAIDRIEDWVAKYGIECDFRRVDGYLFRAPESDQRILDEECRRNRATKFLTLLTGRYLAAWWFFPCGRWEREASAADEEEPIPSDRGTRQCPLWGRLEPLG